MMMLIQLIQMDAHQLVLSKLVIVVVEQELVLVH